MQLVENLFVKKILYKICSPVWILIGHVIFKLFYNQIYQLKTKDWLQDAVFKSNWPTACLGLRHIDCRISLSTTFKDVVSYLKLALPNYEFMVPYFYNQEMYFLTL